MTSAADVATVGPVQPVISWSRWWPLGAGAALVAGYFMADSDVLPAAFFCLTCVVALVAVVQRLREDRASRAWWLGCAFVSLYLVASGLFHLGPAVTGEALPYPSHADAAYLVSYALFVAFLIEIVRAAGIHSPGDLLDALTFTLCVGALQGVLLLEPILEASDGSPAAALTSVGYQLIDLLLLYMAATMFVVLRRTVVNALLLGAVLSQVVTDVFYTRLSLQGAFNLEHPVNVGWLLMLTLVALAALQPVEREGSTPSAPGNIGLRGRIAVMRVAVLLPLVALVVEARRGDAAHTVFLAVLAIALVQVVLSRLGGLMVDAEEHRSITDHVRVLAASVESSADAIVNTELDGTITQWNRAAELLYGYPSADMCGRHLSAIVPDAGLSLFEGMLERGAQAAVREVATTHARVTGADVPVSVTVSPVVTGSSSTSLCWIFRDTSTRLALESQLRRQAFTDPLTGLANRAMFTDGLRRALLRRQEPGNRVAVVALDLDGFKAVNDALGHAAGDRLLCEVGAALQEVLRPEDTLARLGGDEFAVILDQIAEDRVLEVTARLEQAVSRPVEVTPARTIVPRASAGVYIVQNGDSPAEALQKADVAMYRAKSQGGGYALFDESVYTEAVSRHRLELELGGAADRGELELHYQPIVELQTNAIVGVEALVRWRHPEHGLVAPDQFIPIAEDSGLIVVLGRWVFREACRQAVEWNLLRGPHRRLEVGINFSPLQLAFPDIVQEVIDEIAASGIDPSLVMIEVTETALMRDTTAMIAVLDKLKALGVGIALDDFGTGYSSLGYLRKLPIDVLKLDRSFVQGIATAEDEWSVALAVINLAASLGKKVLAEGIELPAQLAHLRALECTLGQGYLYSRPVPVSVFEQEFLHVDQIVLDKRPGA